MLVKFDHKSLHDAFHVKVILELVVNDDDIVATLMTFRKDMMAEAEDPYAAIDIVFYGTCNSCRQLGARRLDEFGGTSAGLHRKTIQLLVIWTWTLGIKRNTTSTSGKKGDNDQGEKQYADQPHESWNHGLAEISRTLRRVGSVKQYKLLTGKLKYSSSYTKYFTLFLDGRVMCRGEDEQLSGQEEIRVFKAIEGH